MVHATPPQAKVLHSYPPSSDQPGRKPNKIHEHFLHLLCSINTLCTIYTHRIEGKCIKPEKSSKVGCTLRRSTQPYQKPVVLLRANTKVGVRAKHENMGTCHVKRVIQVGGGATLCVRHIPSCVV